MFVLIEILVKRSKILSKIENLVKNQKFGQKPEIWSKIENLVKNRKFDQDRKFGHNFIQKSKNFNENFQL